MQYRRHNHNILPPEAVVDQINTLAAKTPVGECRASGVEGAMECNAEVGRGVARWVSRMRIADEQQQRNGDSGRLKMRTREIRNITGEGRGRTVSAMLQCSIWPVRTVSAMLHVQYYLKVFLKYM